MAHLPRAPRRVGGDRLVSAEDIASRLRQLHRHASELRSLAERLQDQARPQATFATDPSGAIRVEVDPDGVPRVIRAAPDWRRHAEPAGLAACVLTAYQAAAGKAVRALAGTFDADVWRSDAEDGETGPRTETKIRAEAEIQTGRRDSGPGEANSPPPLAPLHGQPRDPLILTEEILKALQTVRARATGPLATYVGRAGRGSLSLTLAASGGLHGCTIEPAWAARQSAATLNAALREALRAARARWSADASTRRAEADLLDTLAGEALATLVHVTGSARPPEEFR